MDASVTETYMGEWKNDKRTGFGISERSDGLRYEGEWFNNRKYGYGVTTFRDGSKEEGKYKNNVLITSQKKKHLFLIRSAKFRERIDAAVAASETAKRMSRQKSDIAASRAGMARKRAETADLSAEHARENSELAQQTARQFAPDFRQPGLERLRNRQIPKYVPPPQDAMPAKSILQKSGTGNPGSGPSSVGDQSATSSPLKSSNVVDAGGTGSLGQNIGQPVRRPSMRPAQNQMTSGQNPGIMQSQMQSPLANPVSSHQLSNQLGQAAVGQNPYGQSTYPSQMQNPGQPQIPLQNQFPNSLPGPYPMGYEAGGVGGGGGPYGPGGGPSQFVVQGGQYAQFQTPAVANQQTDHYPGYPQNPSPQGYANQFQQPYSSQQVNKTKAANDQRH